MRCSLSCNALRNGNYRFPKVPLSTTRCGDAWCAQAPICLSAKIFRSDWESRLVTIGLLASCVAWGYSQLYWTFGILFATALVDVVLYLIVPNALMCYRCGAMYRGAAEIDSHGSFNLETHERHRQQKIRLEQGSEQGVGIGSRASVRFSVFIGSSTSDPRHWKPRQLVRNHGS